MPIDDATWAQVREAYVANEISIAAICRKFNVTSSGSLYSRRIKEGWPLRGTQPAALTAKANRSTAQALPVTGTPPPPTAKPHAITSRAARAALILRLYNVKIGRASGRERVCLAV